MTKRKSRREGFFGHKVVILEELRRHPAGRTTEQLADACYAGARIPDSWAATVRAAVRRLRPLVAPDGYVITRDHGRRSPCGAYVLTRTSVAAQPNPVERERAPA